MDDSGCRDPAHRGSARAARRNGGPVPWDSAMGQPPERQGIRGREAGLLTPEDGGSLLRVIAGGLDGHTGPGSTFTPITLVHATVSAGAEVKIPWRPDFNALAYVLAGSGSAGAERRPIRTGQLVVYGPGDTITFAADA